ncbi:MAG: AmmeMemoRadiSam system radical SAM enzyme [Bacillota bacterium]|nr:AmmeMemoRadiSam system radical SAM enzyme [Bacillota bacterium]
MQEARYYEKIEGDRVWCHLCPQNCRIRPGHVGFCRARKNEGGVLYTLNYGRISAWGVDPIEKKPLYHFYPGSQIFSVGTFGCNFHCGFCQNWQIAHGDPLTQKCSPGELVEIALEAKERSGSIGIAYTYSEPMIWYEYVFDVAKLAREKGLKNVLVTNGSVQEEPLRELLPYVDAMNVDVKAFTNQFYREICHGRLDPVLRTVEEARNWCHVEITNLIVPTKNDAEEEIKALVDWIASLDPALPLHFSRYFPQYKLNLPPTPLGTLKKAREIALQKLQYVYIGNAPELGVDDTFCPVCRNLLVERTGYRTSVHGLRAGRCTQCGTTIEIVD